MEKDSTSSIDLHENGAGSIVSENESKSSAEAADVPAAPVSDDSKATEKFCELLLYGHKKEALDYAMDNGLWGHALFLASKMDDRSYGHVLARFANGLAYNHPLQTLYQIMGGKQPSFVTACSDDGFGEWKPHLAMLLSNAGSKPEIEGKSIITLGDTLDTKGKIFAAQFCYLMAELQFSPSSKLGTLLGFSPQMDNIIESTQMTEIYEFARTIAEPNFYLGPYFMQRKLQYSKTLIDLGFTQQAFAYMEEMGKIFLRVPTTSMEREVGEDVIRLAEKIVRCEYPDPSSEPSWIEDLKVKLYQPTESGSRKTSNASLPDYPVNSIDPSTSGMPMTEDIYDPNNDNHQAFDQTSRTLVPPHSQPNMNSTAENYIQETHIGGSEAHNGPNMDPYWNQQQQPPQYNDSPQNIPNAPQNQMYAPQAQQNYQPDMQTSSSIQQPNGYISHGMGPGKFYSALS